MEALGYIFAKSEGARAALREAGAEVGATQRVETRATGEGGERPDLVGLDGRGTERLIIKAKFWAGLTENQPVAYLERLAEEPSALVFVGPESRRVSLWAELRERVEGAAGLEWRDETRTPGLPSADVGGGRWLLFMSWSMLLGRMASRVSVAIEADAALDIRQTALPRRPTGRGSIPAAALRGAGARVPAPPDGPAAARV